MILVSALCHAHDRPTQHCHSRRSVREDAVCLVKELGEDGVT